MAILTATIGASASACSFGRDEPATVTLPRSNMSTTTTIVTEDPGAVGPTPDTEPLPVAWIAQVGGPGDDHLRAVTGWDAQVVAVGESAGLDDRAAPGGSDIMVAVLSTSGELDAVTTTGSDGADSANGISADATATTCGSTTGSLASANAGRVDAWCAQLGQHGTTTPSSQLGASEDESATGMGTSVGIGSSYVSGTASGLLPGAQDPAGGGVVGNGDALMMQLDDSGQPVWARQFGTATLDAALGAGAVPDGDGLVVGFTDGDLEGPSNGTRDAFVSRFDPSGNQRWVTQIGSSGSDRLSCVTISGEARRGDLRIVAAGTTDGDIDLDGPAANAGANDALVASMAPNGALAWITQFGSAGDETVGGVVSDGQTIYVVGSTGDELGALADGGGVGGQRDGFLAAVDVTTGSVSWVSRFGSPGDEEMTGLAITEDGLLVASGTTSGQVGETAPAGELDGFVIAFPLSATGGGAASSV